MLQGLTIWENVRDPGLHIRMSDECHTSINGQDWEVVKILCE